MKNKLLTILITTAATSLHAASISENFDTSSGSTPPTGWSLITRAGSPTYSTVTGSDGSGGSTGNAGQVTSTDFPSGQDNLPGAYLVNNTVFDMNSTLTVTFDFRLASDGGFDDGIFVIGDIASGFPGNDAGDLLSVKVIENYGAFGDDVAISNGANNRLADQQSALDDDTWYQATFTWTPTSGLTGDASIVISDFTTVVNSATETGFTFDSANAQIGFGSVNDILQFDNVTSVVPEPSTFALLSGIMAFGWLAIRRRRD
jgi:hypothetical protein